MPLYARRDVLGRKSRRRRVSAKELHSEPLQACPKFLDSRFLKRGMSGSASSSPENGSSLSRGSVDAFVETLQHASDGHSEGLADSKEGGYRDGSASFNLLPVSCRKAERDHVLLAESP